jgi:energy-coupling factor transporter ATP-binding protein EcfA2
MSKTNKKSATKSSVLDPSKGLTPNIRKKIWRSIPPETWVKIIKENRNELNPYFSGLRVSSLCPTIDHADTNPSFSINIEEGFCYCFGCNFHSNNPIEIYSIITQKTLAESVSELIEKHKLDFLPQSLSAKLEEQRLNYIMKAAVYSVCHEELCNAIAQNCQGEYGYAKDAISWLIDERKIPVEIIHSLPIGIYPTLSRLSSKLSDQYLARVAKEQTQNPKGISDTPDLANMAVTYFSSMNRGGGDRDFLGSIVFPLSSSIHNISGFKFRKPISQGAKSYYVHDDPFDEYSGLFGLNWEYYKTCWDNKKETRSAYIVEGEMDALSIMAYMASSGNTEYPVFSISGSSATDMVATILKESLVNTLYLVGDAPNKGGTLQPSAGGDKVVKRWIETLSDINSYVFTAEAWNKLAPGDDPDSAVHRVGGDRVIDEFFHNQKDNFISTSKWVYKCAYAELEEIGEEDYRRFIEKAAEYGQLLKDSLDREKFVEHIVTDFPSIKADPLKRSITGLLKTEGAFVENCRLSLLENLYVVGTESGADRKLLLLDKQDQTVHRVKLDSESSIARELSTISGRLTKYVHDKVGYPQFLIDPETPDGDGFLKVSDEKVRFYMNQAVLDLAFGMPDVRETRLLRQGYHRVRVTDSDIREYIVCGELVIKILRSAAGVEYKKLEGPRDGTILFDTGYLRDGRVEEPWFPGGISVDMLNAKKNINLNDMFDKIEALISTGFYFKNHNTVPPMLAAETIYYAINNAFKRQNIMYITGETSSGKSSLAGVFSKISSHRSIRLIYMSQGHMGFTEASVSRLADGCRLLMVLDEAEADEGSSKASAVKAVQETFRGVVSGDGSTRVRASMTSQGVITNDIFCPVMFCAIGGVEKAQDFNRMLIVETQKQPGRDSAINIIERVFGKEYAWELAQDLALGLYPHIPGLLQEYEAVTAEFPNFKTYTGVLMEYRYASSLFPILAIMKYLGKDWVGFLKNYVNDNADNISRAANITESETLVSAMMHNPVVVVPSDNKDDKQIRKASIAQLLSNPALRERINTSSCGLYFEEETDLLLILLDQALTELLPELYTRDGMKSQQLRQSLMRSNIAMTTEEMLESGIIPRSYHILGQGVKPHNVVVLKAKSWVRGAARTSSIPKPPEKGVISHDGNEKDNVEKTQEETKSLGGGDFGSA